mmetsp:Transcript_35882/g.41599  ORF Transcript_35882/g.41599 Transcript_35882/m.41599 type:complete len:237 (-) Transcript_35882:615-1325(-)
MMRKISSESMSAIDQNPDDGISKEKQLQQPPTLEHPRDLKSNNAKWNDSEELASNFHFANRQKIITPESKPITSNLTVQKLHPYISGSASTTTSDQQLSQQNTLISPSPTSFIDGFEPKNNGISVDSTCEADQFSLKRYIPKGNHEVAQNRVAMVAASLGCVAPLINVKPSGHVSVDSTESIAQSIAKSRRARNNVEHEAAGALLMATSQQIKMQEIIFIVRHITNKQTLQAVRDL